MEISYYEAVKEIEEHFEEKKEELIANLKELAARIFRADNLMISYTAAPEGLDAVEKEMETFKNGLFERERTAMSRKTAAFYTA